MRKKSHLKHFFLFCLLAILLAASFGFYKGVLSVGGNYVASDHFSVSQLKQPAVQVGEVKIPVELATTSAAIKKGLSGRQSLGEEQGLLFIFDRPAIYQFWMPDMHFPIDIIWIANDEVVDVDEDVSPKFDPAHPIFYRPSKPADIVLEVNAGWFSRHGLRVGDKVIYSNLR